MSPRPGSRRRDAVVRFTTEMDRLRALRDAVPMERGADPLVVNPAYVHGIVAAVAFGYSASSIALALGIGKSTIFEWVKRADGRPPRATRRREDFELETMTKVVSLLDALPDQASRHRVLNYLDERFFGTAKVT